MLQPAQLTQAHRSGAVLGNVAGILAIVTGAIAALFSPRLIGDGAQFSLGLAGLVLGLSVVATVLFFAGCARLLREIRDERRPAVAGEPERTPADVRIETLAAGPARDDRPTRVLPSFAPREPFILGLPAAALALAAGGLVLELAGLVDVLPSRVIPLALALAIAFGAFMVVRYLQRTLALAKATALFAKDP